MSINPPLCRKRQESHGAEELSDERILPHPDESSRGRRAETRPVVRSARHVPRSSSSEPTTITTLTPWFARGSNNPPALATHL